MTDRIQKFLGKLQEKERQEIEKLIEKIILGDLYGLDVKKLQGSKDMYRARKGDIRVIYRFTDNGIFIIAIERRSENTYKY